MQQKIRQCLNKKYLGWVVIDSLPRAKIILLMSRLGIHYKGMRLESIPPQDLAYDLAEDAFGNIEIMNALIKALNDENADTMEKISGAAESEVESLAFDFNKLFSSIKTGRMLWALVSDSRPAINGLAGKLTAAVEKFMDGEFPDDEKAANGDKKHNRAPFLKKQIKKLLGRISFLEQDIASSIQDCRVLERKNKHLLDKNSAQQAQIIELRRFSGESAKEKGVLNREILKYKDEIECLKRQAAELKNQMAVGPKMRLKAMIHHLQKENSSLAYALEKERQRLNEKASILEKELLQAKQEFRNAAQDNAALSAQLETERQRLVLLQKEREPDPIKREPPLPKEKGRRVGIFIDNQNVYYSAKMHFGKKIDFQKLLAALVKDRHLVKAICYIVTQPEKSQEHFIAMLKSSGFTVRTRDLIRRADGSAKGNWDIGIAADVITMVEKNRLDVVILVTCDGDFVDLVKLLSVKGVRVEVVGFPMNMAMSLKTSADDYYFITQDLMRDSDIAPSAAGN